MVYLTADAALGQRDAHSAIMQDILGCGALRLALQACMSTLASDPVPAAPADQSLHAQGPQAAMHILQQLGQLTVEDSEEEPESAGHSGATVGVVADDLAQQHASTSLGDATFGHAVLLMCRADWGCGERVWRALFAGGSVATLPRLADAVGGGEPYVAAAAAHVDACTAAAGALTPARLQRAAAAGSIASAALREGRWDGKMLRRCSTGSAAGVLWGSWLLGAICRSCSVRRGDDGVDGAGPGGAGGEAGSGSAGTGGSGLRWQLQLVRERLQEEDAVQAAVHLVAAALWWAAKCLCMGPAELVHELESAAACELQEALGGAASSLGDAVAAVDPNSRDYPRDPPP